MKILLISPLCPLPLEKGGAVRIWNIAKQLSQKNTVDLVCFIRHDGERRYEESLRKVFNSVHFIKRRGLFERTALSSGVLAPFKFVISNGSLLTDTLFSPQPLLSQLYQSAEMREYILEQDRSGEYDLLYAETFYSIASLKDHLAQLKTKLLLIEQNIESAAFKRQAEKQANPVLRGLMLHDVSKIKKAEKYFWQSLPLIGGLSPVDIAEIEQVAQKKALLLENGVDIDFFSEARCERTDKEILFVGSFTYYPNIDAVKWLIDEIWPHVISSQPGIQLRLVGRGADSRLKKYVHERGFVIDESVDDIRDAFQRATLLIAPIRAGSGTKYKVLESMASHLPVVTTPVGAEGIGAVSGRELIIGETAAELASSITDLLNNADYRAELAKDGYNFVSKKYDWKQIVGEFETSLARVL